MVAANIATTTSPTRPGGEQVEAGDGVGGLCGFAERHGVHLSGVEEAGDHGRDEPDDGAEQHEHRAEEGGLAGVATVLDREKLGGGAEGVDGHDGLEGHRGDPAPGEGAGGGLERVLGEGEVLAQALGFDGEQEALPAADGFDGEPGDEQGDGDEDDGLEEIRGHGAPVAAGGGADEDGDAGEDDDDIDRQAEDAGAEDGEAEEVEAGVEDAGEHVEGGVKLLGAGAVAQAYDLRRGGGPELAKPRSGPEKADEKAGRVGDEDDGGRPAGLVGHAGGAGEGPGAEGAHEGAAADQPPGAAVAAAKVVGDVAVEALEDPADHADEDQVGGDGDVFDGMQRGGGMHGGGGGRRRRVVLKRIRSGAEASQVARS